MLRAGRSMDAETARKEARASSGGLAGDADRLSALPDCLLHHIMSFMKARQVVQTCVLSTRWTHLWRSVPSLDVDQEEFSTTADADYDRKKLVWEKFSDFTDHLLIPNNISIVMLDTFRLHVSDRSRWGEQAARWIRHGIKYSSALVSGSQGKGLSSSSWRIRKLHLSEVQLDARFTEHVSSGCQYLKHLELMNCRCTFPDITSHSLENLIVKECSLELSAITSSTLENLIINGCNNARRCVLVVTAPVVAYLLFDVYEYKFAGGISLYEMPSLAKASIHLRGNIEGCKLCSDQIKLLGSVSNVTSLELQDFETMKELDVEPSIFPDFKNLRTLLLDYCDLSDDFKILGQFMKNSPNLEKLTLRHCKFSKDLKKRKGTAKSKKRTSSQFANLLDVQCTNLKLTEIIYTDDDVRQLVELLLSISGNLPENNIKLTKVD